MNTHEKRARILERFIPLETVPYVNQLLADNAVHFRIVKPRKTKLGDFRRYPNGKREITVNGDLNKYSFLITTIHEFAHLKAFEIYGDNIKAHGKEWKTVFQNLLLPLIDQKLVPEDIQNALVRSFESMKASSCTDIHLSRVLRKYDVLGENQISIESLSKNSTFALNDRHFRKGELRRTRYLCEDIYNGKKYLISALATVQLIEEYGK